MSQCPCLQSHGVMHGAASGLVGAAKGLGSSVGHVGFSAVAGAKALLSLARRLKQDQSQQDLSAVRVPAPVISRKDADACEVCIASCFVITATGQG
jgi:hypothetical protein